MHQIEVQALGGLERPTVVSLLSLLTSTGRQFFTKMAAANASIDWDLFNADDEDLDDMDFDEGARRGGQWLKRQHDIKDFAGGSKSIARTFETRQAKSGSVCIWPKATTATPLAHKPWCLRIIMSTTQFILLTQK